MSVAVGSGKKCTLDELVRVALGQQPVSVIGQENLTVSKSAPVTGNVLEDVKRCFAPRAFARAAVFSRLHSLYQGRANVKLLDFLASTLNANIVPAFIEAADSPGAELAAFVTGSGKCLSPSEDSLVELAPLLSASGLTAPVLSEAEVRDLTSFPLLAIGSGCLLAAAALSSVRVVDSVASLSCEAAGSSVNAYDAASFEIARPHRGQMQSAANLRLLLDGSKRVNTCPKELLSATASLQAAPQTTGPCRDIILASAKALEIELNSFANGSAFDAAQASLVTQNLCNAVEILILSSKERTAAVEAITTKPAATTPTVNNTSAAIAASPYAVQQLIGRLLGALSTEVVTANDALSAVEASEAAAYLAKLELAEKNKATGAEGEGQQKGKGKPETADDSNLTPEQRARTEAKRKEKAEKAAAKAAAKEQKKASGGASVTLGAGSTQVRQYLQKAAQQSPEGAVVVDSVQRLLDPFDSSENSFANYCTKVLEQLTSGGKFKPKIAKGARDFGPEQMRIREQAFSAIRRVFKRHGGVEIDTPVFELKELLTGKYGEDSKLIYDLADQGGELLSLRYDLTVPFARFLAMRSVGNIKRYHIAKVYRRDQPQAARGRYREFYQCDYDIAGSYAPMVADAEVITVATEILSDLPIGQFAIKLNHRKLLDAIFEISGVPTEKFRPICSAVDKLDKMSWEDVKKEMVEEKGLAPEAADRIATFVLHSGPPKELWAKFTESKLFGEHAQAAAAMADLKLLFDYLDAMGSLQYVSFDMSLARGLDYYTGVIYEAVLINGAVAVGSIAAGGRYDNLVGMFSPAGVQTPCVGVSIGVERVFAIMEKKAEELNIMQSSDIQVYIASIGASLITERMRVAQLLWQANISAEYPHQDNPKFKKQLDEALERGIPFMVVFGSEELAKGVVKVKDMRKHTEVEVRREDLVATLLEQGCFAVGTGADVDFLKALRASTATAAEPEAP